MRDSSENSDDNTGQGNTNEHIPNAREVLQCSVASVSEIHQLAHRQNEELVKHEVNVTTGLVDGAHHRTPMPSEDFECDHDVLGLKRRYHNMYVYMSQSEVSRDDGSCLDVSHTHTPSLSHTHTKWPTH